MKKNIFLAAAMLILTVMFEAFCFSTGSDVLGIISLFTAMAATAAMSRIIRLDYQTRSQTLRKYLVITGLEN